MWICHYSFTPATILLGILYLINTHISDGQHKEPCHLFTKKGTVPPSTIMKTMGENNNHDANPPPPPPLTLEQVLAM
jgi:hypothetical protein